MSRKITWIVRSVALFAFLVLYAVIEPLGNGFSAIADEKYRLTTEEVSADNKWSTFRDEGNGHFFIHTGERTRLTGAITVLQDSTVSMTFSLREGAENGEIEFSVQHQGEPMGRFVVTSSVQKNLTFPVAYGDVIIIEADKHGATVSDWGDLVLTVQAPLFHFQNLALLCIWSVFFLSLSRANYGPIATAGALLFLIFIVAERMTSGSLSFVGVVNYSICSMVFTFLYIFFDQRIRRQSASRVVAFLFAFLAITICLMPIAFIIYKLNFNTAVTQDILFAIFQTNGGESVEYLNQYIEIEWAVFPIAVAIVVGGLFYLQSLNRVVKQDSVMVLLLISCFVSVVAANLDALTLPKFSYDAFETYQRELKLFKDMQNKRAVSDIDFDARKDGEGETYIVVIGESLNKHHMSLYGYHRPSTPGLDNFNAQGELVVFKNAYANHTHTVRVLSQSLTEANQLNGKEYFDSLSIINVLRVADVETYWLTNQNMRGVWDNMVAVLASEADHLTTTNYSVGETIEVQNHDGALLTKLDKILAKKTTKNRAIFIHLMGSHTDYCARYPDEFQVFNTPIHQGEFGINAHDKLLSSSLNCYDNSVRYTDFILSSILSKIKSEDGPNALLFFSDHGEDVMAGLGHNSGMFTFEMVEIPMLGWFSQSYKEKYRITYENLKRNIDKLYSNDFIFDTILGLINVETNRYNASHDLGSSEYSLTAANALTLHGQRTFVDKNNFFWWQKKNVEDLLERGLSSRVFPHRVNSLGKLNDVWYSGFRSFEVDVRFGDNNTRSYQVGHDELVMGHSFEELLDSVPFGNIDRIWFDLKNLTEENSADALDALESLDRKYHFKGKLIVESGTDSATFKIFREHGWHTSYYTPTNAIVSLLEQNDTDGMELLAEAIANRVKEQKVSAISFDNRTYSFIKTHVEPLLEDDIIYHAWYGPPVWSDTFTSDLVKNALFLDKRVKTILVEYRSRFHL